jgi:glucans biosynthesis protein C
MRTRRYDIDWLRVIAMLGVFVLHCTRFFDNEDWHVKAVLAERSDIWELVRSMVIWTWLMPLFFLVSGFAAQISLSRRSAGQFLWERVKRILVPLYTVGLFVIVVPQAYLDRLTHGRITGTFWQWLPSFYRNLPRVMANLRDWRDPLFLLPYEFQGHLWFLQMLFIITLIFLPIMMYLKSERGRRLTDRLAGWSTRRGGLLVFAIPVALGQIALQWLPVTTDRTWGDLAWYGLFFLIGYIISTDERFTASAKRHTWLCLALWLVPYIVVGGLFTFVLEFQTDPGQGFSALFVIWQLTWSLICWSAVVFMLGLGARYLNRNTKFLAYSNEAVLPFYMFHQTVMLVIGWYVLQWNIGVLAKFALIGVITFALSLGLYEAFVKRIGFMRFLFGMAPRKKQVSAASQVDAKGATQ